MNPATPLDFPGEPFSAEPAEERLRIVPGTLAEAKRELAQAIAERDHFRSIADAYIRWAKQESVEDPLDDLVPSELWKQALAERDVALKMLGESPIYQSLCDERDKLAEALREITEYGTASHERGGVAAAQRMQRIACAALSEREE